MLQFQCEKCGTTFEDQGQVLEYTSPVYGPCSKKVSDCPGCGCQSDEYRPPKQSRSGSSAYSEAVPAMGGCAQGGCCCAG